MLCQILLTSLCLTSANAQPNVVEIAANSQEFTTLVAAVTAADLATTLTSEGPFTIFAPSNSAFGRIDGNVLNTLLNEPGTPALKQILLHHVVLGNVTADQLQDQDVLTTAAGTTLTVTIVNDRVLIDDAAVTQANIIGSNGVIHKIDRVVLPPPQEDPIETLLYLTIERGVDLYNNGMEGACADVYATALDAVLLLGASNIDTEMKSDLSARVLQAAMVTDHSSRAWAYRRIIDLILTSSMKGISASSRGENTIFEFDNSNEGRDWQIVLDGVMGGLSTGDISVENGSLFFTGKTSLKNNGGFSSIRASMDSNDMDAFDAIQLRVRGDGRTWIFGTRGSNSMGANSYWSRFETKKNEWIKVTIPINEMERHSFGNRLPGSINPDEIIGVEFYMYDKKAGPFKLEVDSIKGISLS
jgi:NADH dehydrogenase [ubiquinone] 1 alpha subcomplex assembly factor 1